MVSHPERELRKLFSGNQTTEISAPKLCTSSPAHPLTAPAPEPAPQNEPARVLPGPSVSVVPLYDCATIRPFLDSVPMHEVDRDKLAGWLAEVVRVESPVHWKEAARRVILGAQVQRMGNRIETTFEEAVRRGTARHLFARRGEFLWSPGMTEPPVRDRSKLPQGSRKLDLVAPEEIHRAILMAVNKSCGMAPEEIPGAVCQMLGFARVTDDMRAAIEPHREALIRKGLLKLSGLNLTVVS